MRSNGVITTCIHEEELERFHIEGKMSPDELLGEAQDVEGKFVIHLEFPYVIERGIEKHLRPTDDPLIGKNNLIGSAAPRAYHPSVDNRKAPR